ncbi:MAG: AsmA family protein [Legionellaceae bacterium]|nr:AsmA family protein [Legionellaceae bacterium]
MFKKFLVALSLCVAVTLASWFILSHFLHTNTMKSLIAKKISAVTGQTVTIRGNIHWQLLPYPGLYLEDITLGDPKDNQHLHAYFKNISLHLSFTALSQGKLLFHALQLHDFLIHIPAKNPIEKSPTKNTASSTKNTSINFAIDRILLNNGTFEWQLASGKNIQLHHIQLGAEHLRLDHQYFPVQCKASLKITDPTSPPMRSTLSFQGQLAVPAATSQQVPNLLKSLGIKGSISATDTLFRDIIISKIHASIDTQAANLLLNPLTFSTMNGESIGDANYQRNTSLLFINQTATNLSAKPLFNALFKTNALEGHVDLSLHAKLNLAAPNYLDSISGNGSLNIRDGVLNGFNINQYLQSTEKFLIHIFKEKSQNNCTSSPADKSQNAANCEHIDLKTLYQFDNPQFYQGKTPFKLLSMQYHMQDGVASCHSFLLQSDLIQLQGEGALHLKNNTIQAQLLAQMHWSDPALIQLQKLLGDGFPLNIDGDIAHPSINPDLRKLNPLLHAGWLTQPFEAPIRDLKKQVHELLKPH